MVEKSIEETRKQAQEIRDKENRRNNVILYKVRKLTLAVMRKSLNMIVTFSSICVIMHWDWILLGTMRNAYNDLDEEVTHQDRYLCRYHQAC